MDYCYSRLSEYISNGIKVIDQWNDRGGSPLQDGANNATIELENGSRMKIIYMYEDYMWMPE